MDRINTEHIAEDLFGAGKHGWRNSNLGIGIEATEFNADWVNGVQEELMTIIEGAGVVPDRAVRTQVNQAIKRLAGANVTTVNAANSPLVLTADNAGLVILDASAGNISCTLPLANVLAALCFKFVRTDATANTATVNRAGADTIDGAVSAQLAANPDHRVIVGTGAAEWLTVSSQANNTVLVPKRQAILAGAAAFVGIGAGLACDLLATATPARFSFAAGVGASGAIDYIGSVTADQAAFWSGLTASTTNYLFVDRNAATGVLTGVSSILPYIAQDSSVAPSIVNGRHTYLTDVGQMYVGNGATATAVQRTAVGHCVTSGAAVTSVVSYAKMRRWSSGRFAIVADTTYNQNHHLGVVADASSIYLGTAASEEMQPAYFVFTANYYGVALYAMDSQFVAIRANNLSSAPGSGGGLGGAAVNQARIHLTTTW